MTTPVVAVDPWLEGIVSRSVALAALREFFGDQELVEVGAMESPNTAEAAKRGMAGSHIASWSAPNKADNPPTPVIWVMQDAAVFEKTGE